MSNMIPVESIKEGRCQGGRLSCHNFLGFNYAPTALPLGHAAPAYWVEGTDENGRGRVKCQLDILATNCMFLCIIICEYVYDWGPPSLVILSECWDESCMWLVCLFARWLNACCMHSRQMPELNENQQNITVLGRYFPFKTNNKFISEL